MKNRNHIKVYSQSQSYMDLHRDGPKWGKALGSLCTLTRPQEFEKYAKDIMATNGHFFRRLIAEKRQNADGARSVASHAASALTREDIRRVVQRNIMPEYDHPQIVEAVTDYLFHHFSLM